MKLLIAVALVMLTGCTTFSSRIAEMRTEAQRCEGSITLSVSRTGSDDERTRYTCTWDNNHEE
jgi:uncharacterized lipoprotein YajG